MKFYLLSMSAFVLSTISMSWSVENPSNTGYNRPSLTQHTFYSPAHLDRDYQNQLTKKRVLQRPCIKLTTFIPFTISEQEQLVKWSRITEALTIQEKFELAAQEKKSINGLLKGDNLLLSKIFSDFTSLIHYVTYRTTMTGGSYTTLHAVSEKDCLAIKKLINDKLQKISSNVYNLDSVDIHLLQEKGNAILDLPYKNGSATFLFGKYLNIRTYGPKAHPQNKSIAPTTRNEFGCNIFNTNYLHELFYNHCQSGMRILDIGSGAGANAFEALKKGAEVTVIDLSAANLELLWGSTVPEYRQKLWLTVNPFPEKTTFHGNSFNGILMSHVAQYLKGYQLRLGIEKIHKWLIQGESFFFQALTPYSNPYMWGAFHADFVAKYGQEWPGYFNNEKQELMHRHELTVEPTIMGCMPNFGHPIHPYIIERELKRVGFEIKYINYGSFSPTLSKKYPIPYQEIEGYVKNGIDAIKKDDIESALFGRV